MKQIRLSMLTLALSLLSWSANAQSDEQQVGHMQYGIKAGGSAFFYQTHSYYDVTAGWRFNEKHYLGLGTGLHRIAVYDDADPDNENGIVPSIPLYLDYIHYMPLGERRKVSFYSGIEAGGGIFLDKLPRKDWDSRMYPYLNGKIGFDFSIHNQVGINFGLNMLLSAGSGIGVSAGLRF